MVYMYVQELLYKTSESPHLVGQQWSSICKTFVSVTHQVLQKLVEQPETILPVVHTIHMLVCTNNVHGVQTTGYSATGWSTNGVQTTGYSATGWSTNRVQTTGYSATGWSTNGVQTTTTYTPRASTNLFRIILPHVW